jgi:hypothetical protein
MPPATSKEAGLAQIQAVVARFAINEPHYRSADFAAVFELGPEAASRSARADTPEAALIEAVPSAA